jgi:hypothetical protein
MAMHASKPLIFLLFIILLISGCKSYRPIGGYKDTVYSSVDYSKMDHWAAHPDKVDLSDNTPEGLVALPISDVDVFFLYPTSYTGDKGQDQWNADINDAKLNKKTDKTSILYQASAFNLAGKVYAPYYRQAHIDAYWSRDKSSAKKAFDLAYSDVKAAFEYYLIHHNQGRPIILAAHSQGSTHGQRLITEFFEGKPLQKQLIAAYLLGMPLPINKYKNIPPCEHSDDIGCTVSWRTFQEGHYPFAKVVEQLIVTNPLSWTRDTVKIDKSQNPGSIFYKFGKIKPSNVSAQIHKDILWCNKPRFRGSILLRGKNYHVGDVNLYYVSIRENAVRRAKNYMGAKH